MCLHKVHGRGGLGWEGQGMKSDFKSESAFGSVSEAPPRGLC